MKAWFKGIFKRVYYGMNMIIEKISSILYLLVIIFVLFISTQALSLCIVYFQILNSSEVSKNLFLYINIWKILSVNFSQDAILQNSITIKTKIEFLMNMAIALSGVLLSSLTLLSYFKKKISEKSTSSFKKVEIISEGDDIRLMCQYYNSADFVCIFSSTFDWVEKNEEAKEILINLAKQDKLKLYTGGILDNVKNTLSNYKELVNSLEQAAIQDLRFSYIERNNAKYILYRQEAEEHNYIILVREKYESQYLIQVISQLVKE